MARQLTFELLPDVAPAFDNFLVGRNRELVAHLAAFAAGDSPERSIVVWGPKGSGKSHLAAATLAAAEPHAACIDAEAEVTELGQVEQVAPSGRVAELLPVAPIGSRSLYCVEDVDRLSALGQGNLFTLFNACREAGARLLMTARTPPLQSTLRDDLRTRLGWGLVLEAKPLDDADKPAALAAYAEQHGFRLGSEVIAFLLSHVRRDMGTLLSTLRALDRHSLATKRPITVPLVRELLQPSLVIDSPDGGDALASSRPPE